MNCVKIFLTNILNTLNSTHYISTMTSAMYQHLKHYSSFFSTRCQTLIHVEIQMNNLSKNFQRQRPIGGRKKKKVPGNS